MSRHSRRTLAIATLLVMAAPAAAQDRTDAMIAKARALTAVDADGCLTSRDDDEIIVCGMRAIDRQQRLPFPELAITPGKPPPRGEVPNGNAEIVQQGRCYVTTDERNCFKGLRIVSVGLGSGAKKLQGPGRMWQIISEPVVPKDTPGVKPEE
ncbi:MAG: hypothetical protein U5J78_01565 [Parasphingorhabdus sp.]|nr:hypothetical protein [Parasphingorhabdus sp.]